ncbi:hypothetical protein [Kineosporia sp. NBRC 101731]|uniref:hypothetical protein n=1 Tax=Kineosporia sp. NBRC 101731 TaxID=3032199 RepID=UPI0024A506D2|nr:hypothetical protein [Kineosporia sp. NBRC 101731]GLY28848.1 hypothetical protein Kisp02_22130 [Kineosporia sp. NBRC 101731]
MFSDRLSRRTKTVTAMAAVPAVAAGLWVATVPAHAATEPVAVTAAAAKPIAGKVVVIKTSKYKGKDRLVTVRGNGSADLFRSKPTKSNGLSADGTSFVLKKVGGTTSTRYTIKSLNDSEEARAYCLQQKQNGKLNIVVCNSKKTNQQFSFEANGKNFAIAGKWGYLKADKRKLRVADIDSESMSFFSVKRR